MLNYVTYACTQNKKEACVGGASKFFVCKRRAHVKTRQTNHLKIVKGVVNDLWMMWNTSWIFLYVKSEKCGCFVFVFINGEFILVVKIFPACSFRGDSTRFSPEIIFSFLTYIQLKCHLCMSQAIGHACICVFCFVCASESLMFSSFDVFSGLDPRGLFFLSISYELAS